MAEFVDAGHRPHAIHTGEEPEGPIVAGPEGITVTLDTWGPIDNLFSTLYDMLQSNWGDAPSRTVNHRTCNGACRKVPYHYPLREAREQLQHRTGMCLISGSEMDYVESLFAGRTLPQAKELIAFSFLVDGVSRTCTHQLVRARIGAAFMQHGGRDNDWRHRPWRMPETIRRACVVGDAPLDATTEKWDGQELKHCLTDKEPIEQLLVHDEQYNNIGIEGAIRKHIEDARQLYAALVDAGTPWQDARFLLPDGMTTYIHCNYTYAALESVLANRLEHIMQWEINCVAQLMLREIKMKCPPPLSKYLGSRSDKMQTPAFAKLESWPPDEKYPVSRLLQDLPRAHRPEQNPFWVLHPDSMEGGSVRWIPTNGVYPHEELKEIERARTANHVETK